MDTNNNDNKTPYDIPTPPEATETTSDTPQLVIVQGAETETTHYRHVWVDNAGNFLEGSEEQMVHTSDEDEDVPLVASRGFEPPANMFQIAKRTCGPDVTAVPGQAKYLEVETDAEGIIHEAVHVNGVHEFPFGVIVPHLYLRQGDQLYEVTFSNGLSLVPVDSTLQP